VNEVKITEQFPFQFKKVDRPDGVHLSDIIKLLTKELFPKDFYDEAKLGAAEYARVRLQWELGLVWEDVLSAGLGNRYAPRWEPRQTKEGIWLSPDGIEIVQNDGVNVVHEYKLTSLKSDKTPKAVIRWMWQVKSYCLHFGAMEAVFHVLYTRGNYQPPFTPQYEVYKETFTPQELIENWQMLVNYAKSKGML